MIKAGLWSAPFLRCNHVQNVLHILHTLHMDRRHLQMPALDEKRNITLRLSRQTIQKARVLAAQRSTSISGLLTSQIEQLANTDDDYERAMKRAFARM